MMPERQLQWDDDLEPEPSRSYRGQFVFGFALEPRLAPADFHALNAEYRSRPPRQPRGPADETLALNWEADATE